jgi:FlaA1/EpsC-like NDP-sugar epimerase
MTLNFGEFIKDKRILVTGGSGSIGRLIVKSLLQYSPKKIAVLSRDATKQILLQTELGNPKNVRFLVGDIRDADRVLMACEDIDVIFHAAGFKFVPQGEYNPFEVIQTNVIGTQNLINAALRVPSVTHFVMISTDKAVAPVNTMGASKLLAERLVSATHYIRGKKEKVFTTVRFGNVLGTTGSLLPLFHEQIKRGELVVTHPEMVRFFMTIPDAVKLVFDATLLAKGGEIFVLKMPSIAIKDLAGVFASRFSKDGETQIKYSSIRQGERLNEALLTLEEARSTLETDDMFIILPQTEVAGIPVTHLYPNARPLTSQKYDTKVAPRLSHEEISKLLDRVLLT